MQTVYRKILPCCLVWKNDSKNDLCFYSCVCYFHQFPAPVVTPEIAVSNEEVPSTSQGLPLAPQLPPAEPQLDLEQQWQDIMAIMELQVCNNS